MSGTGPWLRDDGTGDLFLRLYFAGVLIFVIESAPSIFSTAPSLVVLLRYVRAHQHSSAQALEWAAVVPDNALGRGADGSAAVSGAKGLPENLGTKILDSRPMTFVSDVAVWCRT